MPYQTYKAAPDHTAPIWNDGRVQNSDAGLLWAGPHLPPEIGSRVRVTISKLGWGTVTGYFSEGCWLGLLVRLDDPPEWYVKQNGRSTTAHIFGLEFDPR